MTTTDNTPAAHAPPALTARAAMPHTRGLTRLWRAAPSAAADHARLALVERVLAARAIPDGDARKAYLDPALTDLADPSLIPDLDRAAARLLDALHARQPIVVYGDYDVDGITASAILFHMLRAIAPDAPVTTYVPHRVDEGYGINSAAIEQLAADGAAVIVSVDCGITAREPAQVARARAVDLIITDHHTPPSDRSLLPNAYAVVHPRLPGSAYPFAELSGAGVAYKLAWRLATMHTGSTRVSPIYRALLLDLLALAALGTIADVVPLVGENRVLARFGLRRIKDSPLPGLRALVVKAGLAGENVDAEDVGFKLGPRLNACGRLGHAREAVELLTVAGPERAEEIAVQLTRLNEERRSRERTILDQAADLAKARGMTADDRRAIVLASEDWHRGVVGIVCSRLVERFSRPTILMDVTNGLCHGSGRSIDGFDLHDALSQCADNLETFGGHQMAAGLKLRHDRLPAFTEAFTHVANSRIAPDRLVGILTYDCNAELADLTESAVHQLSRMAPFGRDNPRVRVRIDGLRITHAPRVIGAHNKHIIMTVQAGSSGPVRKLVGWNWAEHAEKLAPGRILDAVLTPKISTLTGAVEPEIDDLCLRL